MANTYIVGGKNGGAYSSNNNGGGYFIGGTATFITCQKDEGAPTSDSSTWGGSQTACTVTDGHASAQIAINKVGAFADCVIGTIVHVEFNDATYTDDWYRVVDQGDDYIDIPVIYISDKTCDCNVGGAFSNSGYGFDVALGLLTATSGDHIQITTDPVTGTVYSVAVEMTTPAIAGDIDNIFKIYGVNYTDGSRLAEDDARPAFQASASITSILSWLNTSDYYNVFDIEWDGNDNADHCWHYGDAHYAEYHKVTHCRFHDALSHGINLQFILRHGNFADNEIDNNGGDGISGYAYYSHWTNNDIHDNTSDGAYFTIFIGSTFEYNRVYNNGAKGLFINSNYINKINDNTIYGNTGDGIDLKKTAGIYEHTIVCTNNTIVNNGGYGINNSNIGAEVWPQDMMFLGYNHSYNNTSGHCAEMDVPASDDEWLTFMDGNNITGDPKFISTTEGSEDFDLEYNSPLQRTGLNNTTIGAGTRKNPGGGIQVLGGGIVR